MLMLDPLFQWCAIRNKEVFLIISILKASANSCYVSYLISLALLQVEILEEGTHALRTCKADIS